MDHLSFISLRQAAKILKDINNSDLVAFKTETVMGLGANCTNDNSVLNIFRAKNRDPTNPLIVHVSDMNMIKKYTEDMNKENIYNYLAREYWLKKNKGGLTIICNLKKDSKISNNVTLGSKKIALRIPNKKDIVTLIHMVDEGIAAPSANRSNHVSATKFCDLQKDFDKKIYKNIPNIYILGNNLRRDDGFNNELNYFPKGVESTIIEIDEISKTINILRPGIVSKLHLNDTLKNSIGYNDFIIISGRKRKEIKIHPGNFEKHYSPNKPLFIVNKSDRLFKTMKVHRLKDVILLDICNYFLEFKNESGSYISLCENYDEKKIINNLYKSFRWAEQVEGRYIWIPNIEKFGGEYLDVLNDRIFRAAEGKQINILN